MRAIRKIWSLGVLFVGTATVHAGKGGPDLDPAKSGSIEKVRAAIHTLDGSYDCKKDTTNFGQNISKVVLTDGQGRQLSFNGTEAEEFLTYSRVKIWECAGEKLNFLNGKYQAPVRKPEWDEASHPH